MLSTLIKDCLNLQFDVKYIGVYVGLGVNWNEYCRRKMARNY